LTCVECLTSQCHIYRSSAPVQPRGDTAVAMDSELVTPVHAFMTPLPPTGDGASRAAPAVVKPQGVAGAGTAPGSGFTTAPRGKINRSPFDRLWLQSAHAIPQLLSLQTSVCHPMPQQQIGASLWTRASCGRRVHHPASCPSALLNPMATCSGFWSSFCGRTSTLHASQCKAIWFAACTA